MWVSVRLRLDHPTVGRPDQMLAFPPPFWLASTASPTPRNAPVAHPLETPVERSQVVPLSLARFAITAHPAISFSAANSKPT